MNETDDDATVEATDPQQASADEPASQRTGGSALGWVLRVAVVLGILLVTAGVIAVITLTEPEAQKETAVKRTAMMVETTGVEAGTFTPVFTALGVVRPDLDVDLRAQVPGRVTFVDERFLAGRLVEEGTPLVRLFPADLANSLAQRRSALSQAEAELALEKGRQAVARAEREQIDGPVSAEQEALILREPQLQATQARVDAARAAVDQAALDLSRTTIRAPFDAMVIAAAVNPGSQVDPGVSLGRLVGVERFFVELTLPVSRLQHLPPASADGPVGSPVRIRDRGAFPEGVSRDGTLLSIVRQVDDRTRLARLIVAVEDPLALEPTTAGPPLTAGAFVEAHVDGAPLEGVVRLPRELLRKGETVWTMEGGQLRIREVDVVVEDATWAYIGEGLAADARVVTTDLATVTEGAPLRLADDATGGDAAEGAE